MLGGEDEILAHISFCLSSNSIFRAASSLGSLSSRQAPTPPSSTSSPSSNLLPLLRLLNGNTQQQSNAATTQPQPVQASQAPTASSAPSASNLMTQAILELLSQSNTSNTPRRQQQSAPVVAATQPPPPQQSPPSQQADQNQLIASLFKVLSTPTQTPGQVGSQPSSMASPPQPPVPSAPQSREQSPPPPPTQAPFAQTDVARALLQLLSSQSQNRGPATVSDYSASTRSLSSSDDWSAGSASRSNGSNSVARPPAEVLGPHDVLLGRGSGISNHIGNIKFRKLVEKHKSRYVAASRVDKPKVAGELVAIWRKLDPPGRFLARCESNHTNPWVDVGDHRARQKTSQCLRERERGPQKEHERKRKRLASL